MTNYEKIMNEMTITKMAKAIHEMTRVNCSNCPFDDDQHSCVNISCNTDKGWREWLEEQSE